MARIQEIPERFAILLEEQVIVLDPALAYQLGAQCQLTV